LIPITLIIADFLAIGADRQKTAEQLDLGNNVVLEELSLIPANCSVSVKDDADWT